MPKDTRIPEKMPQYDALKLVRDCEDLSVIALKLGLSDDEAYGIWKEIHQRSGQLLAKVDEAVWVAKIIHQAFTGIPNKGHKSAGTVLNWDSPLGIIPMALSTISDSWYLSIRPVLPSKQLSPNTPQVPKHVY